MAKASKKTKRSVGRDADRIRQAHRGGKTGAGGMAGIVDSNFSLVGSLRKKVGDSGSFSPVQSDASKKRKKK